MRSARREVQLQSPTFRSIPTIVMSAMRAVPELESLFFAEVIAKPVPFQRMLEALATICPSRALG